MDQRAKKILRQSVGNFAGLIGVPMSEKYKPTFEWKPSLKKPYVKFKWNKI